jgi:hypothetical protein
VQWDGMGLPQFVFAFPPQSPEMVTFFQLSGRVCEVLTQSEWVLNIGGYLFDIPNLLPKEIDGLIPKIQNELGYLPVAVPYQLGNRFGGTITLPLILWVEARTGRADMYSPSSGVVQGQQLLQPWSGPGGNAGQVAAGGYEVRMTPQGAIQGGGERRLLESLSQMADDSHGISDFLSSGVGSIDFGVSDARDYQAGAYDAATQFEEDSAGWPGGAYENPDSGWYTPDYSDDY